MQAELLRASLKFLDCNYVGANLHNQNLNSNEDKSWLRVTSAGSTFVLLISTHSASTCLCVLLSAARGDMASCPSCHPSIPSFWDPEKQLIFGGVFVLFCFLNAAFVASIDVLGAPDTARSLVWPRGLCRVDCRTQTFISTIKRQLCGCLC